MTLSRFNASKQSLDVLQGAKHWRVTDFAANKEIILSGMAWGGMPEHLITEELDSGELVPIHVKRILIYTNLINISNLRLIKLTSPVA